MATPPQYPLEQVISIKKNRFDQAIKTLEAKKEILEKAYEKLFELTEELNVVTLHKKAKLDQLRDSLDAGTSSDKVQQMKAYLKVVDERVAEKKKKVEAGQKAVDTAQAQVDLATDDLFQKKKDLEKLELHKKEWEKESAYVLERKEEAEHDEQGSAGHSRIKREKKLRNKRGESS
jgi:flagellar biosynthesis chaperone FliJ